MIEEAQFGPIRITGKKSSAILISEEEWGDVEETLYLLSIPGMKESLIKAKNTPPEECSDTLDW